MEKFGATRLKQSKNFGLHEHLVIQKVSKMNEPRSKVINDFAPSSLSHIVGQRGVVEQVKVALDAAFEDQRKMDSCLMVGPPGVGKSALANVIAAEMATEYQEVL